MGFKKSSGRNNFGKITVRGRVGNKSSYFLLDLKRRGSRKIAIVVNNNKNSIRNTLVSLIKYSSGGYSYVLSALGFISGFWTQSIWRPERFSFKYVVGCAIFLKHIPPKSVFFGLEIIEGSGSKIARSAGTYCGLLTSNHGDNTSIVKIPSGKKIIVSSYCMVVLGKSNNHFFYKTTLGKCGSNIGRGFKSKVRGVAMNPVDHPNGGRTKSNSPERNLWGKIAKKNK